MRSERIQFPGVHGTRLAALADRPPHPPRAWALLAHCFTCSKDLKPLARISRALVAEGLGVFRFDFTGLGESGGQFAHTDFSSNLDDLVAAADWLRHHESAPQILLGHSLGGAAAIAAAHRIPEARAVATIGAPSEPRHLLTTLGPATEAVAEHGEAEVEIAGQPFTIRRELLDDLAEHRLAERLAALDRPLLVFHSPADRVVGIEHAAKIFAAARHPKSFVSLDRADHLLLRDPSDADLVARLLAAWASRYLAPEAETEQPPLGELWAEIGEGGYTTRLLARTHRGLADEPTTVGGDDLGWTPYELLLASLGSCTAMTLRMYADRKQWPLERVRVRLEHRRVHAEDCAHCDTTEGMLDRITRRLEIDGPLDEAQRERLVEIANRCPVHRTLTAEIDVQTLLHEDVGVPGRAVPEPGADRTGR